MATTPRRIVITGIGVFSCVGSSAVKYWTGIRESRSGIRTITYFDASPLTTRIAGEIPDFDAKEFVEKKERKSLRVMARPIQFAVAAAQQAMDDAGIDKTKLDPTRFGVEFGSGIIPSELVDLGHACVVARVDDNHADSRVWAEKGLPLIPPLWMLKYLPNMPACHVSILQNAQGPSNSITQTDVAGLLALGEAGRIIQRNAADFFLVGGADAKVNPMSMLRQASFGHLSKRNDAPEKACRPFDKDRDGVVLGEGGSVLALEELEHAKNRGARIYGEVVGFGSAFDNGLTGTGLARAIRVALAKANIQPDQLDHVNASGLGSVKLDAFEARGIREAVGDVPVWTVKPIIGNQGAGSGCSELAASLLAMQHNELPGTLNYETPDPACPVEVNRVSRKMAKPYFLKLSFTELGQCAAVVCRRWD